MVGSQGPAKERPRRPATSPRPPHAIERAGESPRQIRERPPALSSSDSRRAAAAPDREAHHGRAAVAPRRREPVLVDVPRVGGSRARADGTLPCRGRDRERVSSNAVDERLEEGLQALEEQAALRCARSPPSCGVPRRTTCVPSRSASSASSRATRPSESLIASSDERFQALSPARRPCRGFAHRLAETGRASREAMEASRRVHPRDRRLPHPSRRREVRKQLEQVERHIAEAFTTLDERDRALTESDPEAGAGARGDGGAGDLARRRGDAGLRPGRRRSGRTSSPNASRITPSVRHAGRQI